ncbi:MAG: UDP-4-amino-4,6-dideoxy-N-acetyl-beta-L-altrosamine transaminase, partial [bacterium]
MSLSCKAQAINDSDIQAVVDVLRSDWLTTGPTVSEFEQAFADYVGTREAVSVSNGTAALHAAMFALNIQPGDEVLIPAITFVATANAVVFQGGRPVFADVEPDTLLLDPTLLEVKITPRTKGIIAVDYAGQPCDYDALQAIADRHSLRLVADACHAVGGEYNGRHVGCLADLSTFSFHPVKNMTTGEGGMVTTDDTELAKRMRKFRNHGVATDFRQREVRGTWFYEMTDLGYNYRLTDLQCALGMSQLRQLPGWIIRRQEIAKRYRAAFADMPFIEPLKVRDNVSHAYHLFVVRVKLPDLPEARDTIFKRLRSNDIPVNVHYIPVHLQPFYCQRFGTGPGLCPVAEAAYEEILSLPIHPNLSDDAVDEIAEHVLKSITITEPCQLTL